MGPRFAGRTEHDVGPGGQEVISVTLTDLLFRARQFLIALVGVALVLAMALLLSGLANGFTAEVQWTVDGVGADHWVMATGGAPGCTVALDGRAVHRGQRRTGELQLGRSGARGAREPGRSVRKWPRT